ncbi:uncharacterized protein LOC125673267 [Ostrea edulis]|uniref:uncharacterized protein LOC125673267 n=1 Tax=Ostrea edulis TaxID=37623 RepID=UPI002094A9CF|nr:uncharacterized protein LOC125673267 [Ostrea edulis]
MIFRKCVVLYLIVVSVCIQGTDTCNQTGPNGQCCEHYRWNTTTGECTPCPQGYTGETCDAKCPYPTYGVACQSVCACKIMFCNVVTGCPVTTGTTMEKEKIYTSESHVISFDVSYNATNTQKEMSTVNSKSNIRIPIEEIKGWTQHQRHIMIAIICLSVLMIFGFSIYLMFSLPRSCLRYFKSCRQNRETRDQVIELA